MTSAINHRHILVTRPLAQSQGLINLLSEAGAIPFCVPTLEIKPLDDLSSLIDAAKQLSQADIIIFTSTNAVRYAIPLLKSHQPVWPPQVTTLAIGTATRESLLTQGWQNVVIPADSFNSEALLQLPELQQLHDQKIIIFCGLHPRPLLATTLRERQAHIQLAFCYERFCPDVDIKPLLDQFKQGKVDVIISTSNESLCNLFTLFGEQHKAWLLKTPIVVISPAMAATLASLGYPQTPIVALNASDSGIMAALTLWYEEQHHER